MHPRSVDGTGNPASNWYVLTGRPCSGISTTLAALAARGYRTLEEAARSLIDERLADGQTIGQVRSNDVQFQRDVLMRKVWAERRLPTHTRVFLDRAIPDSIAYHRIAGLDPAAVSALCVPGTYRKIFFLEPLPYASDYARTETDAVLDRLQRELRSVYVELGYEVVSVAVCAVEERVERILQQVE